MNTFLKASTVTFLLLYAAISLTAQVPPPPGPPPLPGKPGPDAGPLQQLISISGTVEQYLYNDHYEYDALSLRDSGRAIPVVFPPHIGTQLMESAKKGSAVTVQGFYETAPEGTARFHLVNAHAGGTIISDQPPLPPANPSAEVQVQFSGAVKDLRRTQDGMIAGVLVGDTQLIDLPPGAAMQLQTLLKTGASVSGTGVRNDRPGVRTFQDIMVIHPQTIVLNGQTYLVR